MRNAPRCPFPTWPQYPSKFPLALFCALAITAISAAESAAQSPFSAPSRQPRNVAASDGIFGALFGGGVSGSQSRNSSSYGSYNPNYRGSRYRGSPNRGARHRGSPYRGSPYQGYGGYGPYGYGSGVGRYRTLCVRTCDGYYWPVSYSTTRASFSRDAKQCRSSCAAPARLFVYRNPGAEVAHMVDLEGKAYSQMDNAFRYRTEYVKDCRCKPEPWSDEAKQDYASREAGEAAPEQVNAVRAEVGTQGAVTPASRTYSGGRITQARAANARRRKSRSNDAGRYDGQWWAGSW